MKRLLAATAALVAALSFGAARASADGISWGVNDNAGLYEDGDTVFWNTMLGLGLTTNTITLRFDETTESGLSAIDEQDLPNALAAAKEAGVTVEFDVYPRHARELADPKGPTKFAAFLTGLAEAYPEVTQYVVMNECNQDLFVNPQSKRGRNLSAARCGAFLAAGFDALKAVSPDIFVWGLGLSPRGNRPDKKDHPSTDPIDWLAFLGQWYRGSRRTAPLMDGLDLHPYPIPQSLPFATGYANPRSYSVTNLPRVYAAFYKAFIGTGQPTVGLLGRLPVQLNEVGIQTSSKGRPGYTGIETAAGVLGGLRPPYDTERYQAQWYMKLVDFAECDADIQSVNLFKLVDETSRAGWQSGLYYTGYVPKASAGAVRSEIDRVGGQCPKGRPQYWAPFDALGTTLSADGLPRGLFPFPLGPPLPPRPK
ncbi:MAG TPA: hypothetical protein VLK36_05245 [Gaiellaceae bacterium]|nr:hypothetical protein [Gaiellaceae bacterium]